MCVCFPRLPFTIFELSVLSSLQYVHMYIIHINKKIIDRYTTRYELEGYQLRVISYSVFIGLHLYIFILKISKYMKLGYIVSLLFRVDVGSSIFKCSPQQLLGILYSLRLVTCLSVIFNISITFIYSII